MITNFVGRYFTKDWLSSFPLSLKCTTFCPEAEKDELLLFCQKAWSSFPVADARMIRLLKALLSLIFVRPVVVKGTSAADIRPLDYSLYECCRLWAFVLSSTLIAPGRDVTLVLPAAAFAF